MIAGGIVGKRLFSEGKLVKLLSMAGFVALFAAFFHSFIAGLLGMLLVKKQTKLQLSPVIVFVSIIASAATYFTLKLLDSSAYLNLPDYSWRLSLKSGFVLVLLVATGYVAIWVLGGLHTGFSKLKQYFGKQSWLVWAVLAGSVLSVLYLLGGTLVEFTGNESIIPMFHQAADLGYMGLLWLLIIKLAAIGWSKTIGYRGGMIFPTVFVASVLIALAQLAFNDVNLIYGLFAVLVGAFAADKKVEILL
jgi:H+/Cl- antiporter ClcA